MHVQSTVTEFSGKPGILSHVVTTMDSEVYDHDSSDKQNYVVCNNTDLTITPIPVVASVKHVKATVHYDREGSSEHDRPSNGNVYGENPSLNQPINDTECVASTSNERQLQQPQPLRQRSHDSLLMNSPQESQSNLSSALSLTDQTTSFKDNDGERISMEGSYMGQQHPTNLSASMPAGSNINHTQDGHASGEEIQTNQSQYVLSNQEYTWNQSSNHHGPQPSYFQHPVSIRYQVPPDLTCPHCGNRVKKKVFILHYPASYDCCGNIEDNPVLKLGVTLRRMDVDVTLDILECDHPPNSWPLWYEQNIYKSDVVLCVITENFYHNLINCELRNIIYQFCLRLKPAFRALFIDAKEKKMEYIPPFMRATTCYSVFSDKLIPSDEGFADLYAFLTSQNRFPKPKLGKILILSPRHSKLAIYLLVYYLVILTTSGISLISY